MAEALEDRVRARDLEMSRWVPTDPETITIRVARFRSIHRHVTKKARKLERRCASISKRLGAEIARLHARAEDHS